MRLALPLILLAALARAAFALDAAAFAEVFPRATPARLGFLRRAALDGAPELKGLDPAAPDFDLVAAPLAEQLGPGVDLAAAKGRAEAAVPNILLGAAHVIGQGGARPASARALLQASARWDWYGEPAARALSALREAAARAGVEPLLRDPFGGAPSQEPAGAALGSSAFNALEPAGPRQAPLEPPPTPRKADFVPRAATAAFLVPGIVAAIRFGGLAFTGLALAVSLISLWEFAGLMKRGGRPVSRAALLAGGGALAVSLVAGWPLMPALGLLTGVSAAAELRAKAPSIERAALTVFGAALFGLLPAHLALLRALAPHGGAITLAVFGAAWASDTMAYFFGKRFGRRKIAPRVSPNKTWEGAIAGLAAAILLPLALSLGSPAWLPLAAALKIGLVMGTLGQLGGYVNSFIKRASGAKDSGKLFPGHGGVIDRFDSFLLSAALLYYLLRP